MHYVSMHPIVRAMLLYWSVALVVRRPPYAMCHCLQYWYGNIGTAGLVWHHWYGMIGIT